MKPNEEIRSLLTPGERGCVSASCDEAALNIANLAPEKTNRKGRSMILRNDSSETRAIAVDGTLTQPILTTASPRANCVRKALIRVFLLSALTATRMVAQCPITVQPGSLADDSMAVAKDSAGNYFDHRTSSGTAYSLDCNIYYTVDVYLPGSYTAPGAGNAITIGGGFAAYWPITESLCPSASESVAIYRRTQFFGVWSGWTLVNHQEVKGHWVPSPDIGISAHCALSVPLRVNAILATMQQIRVMVLPKLYGSPMQAAVRWSWTL